jgi:hypothetical protein
VLVVRVFGGCVIEWGRRLTVRIAGSCWEKSGIWAAGAGLIWLYGSLRGQGFAVGEINADRWISRRELAERYGVPVKTPAEWASKGTGPRYAKFGRHVRYWLGDVIAWEQSRFADQTRKLTEE